MHNDESRRKLGEKLFFFCKVLYYNIYIGLLLNTCIRKKIKDTTIKSNYCRVRMQGGKHSPYLLRDAIGSVCQVSGCLGLNTREGLKRLALWKKQCISEEGIIMLIRSTLSSLPLYFMSILHLLRMVRLRPEPRFKNLANPDTTRLSCIYLDLIIYSTKSNHKI